MSDATLGDHGFFGGAGGPGLKAGPDPRQTEH